MSQKTQSDFLSTATHKEVEKTLEMNEEYKLATPHGTMFFRVGNTFTHFMWNNEGGTRIRTISHNENMWLFASSTNSDGRYECP